VQLKSRRKKIGTGKVNGVNLSVRELFSISSLIEQVNLLMKVGETKFNMNTDDIQTKYDTIIGKASVDTTDQAELIADINNLINTINEHLKRVELSKRSISDAINEITVTLKQ
jgi:hypothetical protein